MVASGTTGAVYNGQDDLADITNAGGLSPYGTMGQGGNAFEWMETVYYRPNEAADSARCVRGGHLGSDDALASSGRYDLDPSAEGSYFGFRVASVPEPSCWVLTIFAGGMMLTRRKR